MSRSRKWHSYPALLLAFIVLVGLLQPAARVKAAVSGTSTASCRIMPLGDSITVGSSSGVSDVTKQISYRKDLWDLLDADADYGSIDFVGSLTNGQFYTGFDPHHEGHAGKTDDYVATNVYNWLDDNPADIVLLHIGTNGLNSSPDDVEDILAEIDRYETDSGNPIWVVLARIINRNPKGEQTTTFNDNVEAMANQRINEGDKIFIVDMEDGAGLIYATQPTGDFWDNLHPYHTGYTKMASVWKDGVDQVFVQACNSPAVTNPGDQSSIEGETIQPLQIQASDPTGQALTYSQTGLPPTLGINPGSGLITGTVSYEAYTGTPYNVTVTVTDTDNNQASVDFTWEITNTNRPPQVTQPANQSHAEGAPVNLQILASDPDAGDSLLYSATNLPPGLAIHPSTGWISGTISYLAYKGTPYSVQVVVTDNGSPFLSDSKTFTWTIANVNRPPVFDVLPGNQADAEGETVSLQIQASDPDPDDTLLFSASGLPAGLSIDPATGLISGLLSYNASIGSPHAVSVTVSDGSDQVTANFTWNVADQNGAPQVTSPGSQTDAEKQSVNLKIQASDPDANDSLTFSATGLPAGLQLNPNTGVISGVIASGASANSPYGVTVIVSDNGSPQLTGKVTFDWNVVPYNVPTGDGTIVFLPLVIH